MASVNGVRSKYYYVPDGTFGKLQFVFYQHPVPDGTAPCLQQAGVRDWILLELFVTPNTAKSRRDDIYQAL